MKKFMTMLAAILMSAAAFAQGQLVTWSSHVEKSEGDVYKVIFTGKVAEGYHTYTLTDEFSATEIMDVAVEGGEPVGGPYEISFDDGSKTVLKNVMIGEVWICSGQSNMEMPMRGFYNCPVENALDYVCAPPATDAADPVRSLPLPAQRQTAAFSS